MMNKHYLQLGGLLLLAVVAVSAATKTKLIDNDGVEAIAKTVCETYMGSSTQIGKISTIGQLVAFFQDLSPSHKLSGCRDRSQEALNLLWDVVSQHNENVCSLEKIELIEQFHHRYISKTKKDKRQQKAENTQTAPKLLILFFLHYVNEVSATCKRSLIERMGDSDSKLPEKKEDADEILKVDDFLARFSDMLGHTSGSFKTYDEVSLIWNFVDRLPIKEDNKYLSDTGKRVSFLCEDAEEKWAFQKECLTNLRPIYGALALPVVRLIDLGYYVDGEPFAAELASRKDLRRLIGITQICEFLTPIRIVSTEGRSNFGQMIIMTKESANRVATRDEEEIEAHSLITFEDNLNSMVGVDALRTANPEDAYRLVKSIKANIKKRESVLKGLISSLYQSVKSRVKSVANKLFMRTKTEDKPLIERPEPSKPSLVQEQQDSRVGDLLEDGALAVKGTGEFIFRSGFSMFAVIFVLFALCYSIIGAIFKGIFGGIMLAFGLPLVKIFYSEKSQHGSLLRMIT